MLAILVVNDREVQNKIVNVSRDYFDRLGRQVSIIPLAGAMEIAPIMNLADCIVDIVATGSTLKANGCGASDSIAEISSRLIVNRASMKTRFRDVQELIAQMGAQLD